MAHAYCSRQSSLHPACATSSGRANQSPRPGGSGVAGGVLVQLEEDPVHGVALPGLHEHGVLPRGALPQQGPGLLHGQLRHVCADPGRGGGEPDEEIQLGAGPDQADEGVHCEVRSRHSQAGPPGPEQGEDPGQDGAGRAHREGAGRARGQLPVPRPRVPAHPRAAVPEHHLCLPRVRAPVRERGLWGGPGLPHCAGGAQRGGQVHPAQADDWGPGAHDRQCPAAQPPATEHVHPALH
mmetsp:Transcript_7419/g.11196  ORF Transcript_7419/g.11196 Transcript_7419/m.11196 type:complete len:238 (-) Transcript_7419:771-1484(-)